MKFNPDIHRRRSIRLKGYDYSQNGLYFITICTHNRECLFGDIVNATLCLNQMGTIADTEWQKTAQMRPNIWLHEFVIMPNHIHGIIEIIPNPPTGTHSINPPVGAHCMRPLPNDIRINQPPAPNEDWMGDRNDLGRGQRAPTVGDIVRGYKSAVTRRINELRNSSGIPVWQRNYHEHIIRNETTYLKIAEYIQDNPRRWQEDTYHV